MRNDSNEAERGKEDSGELVIARGDAAEVLEPSEAARDDKVTSAAVIAKKPPRSVVSKSERAAAKMPPKADEPQVERVTKQERLLTPAESSRGGEHRRDDAGNRVAAAQRVRVFGGHGEEETWVSR